MLLAVKSFAASLEFLLTSSSESHPRVVTLTLDDIFMLRTREVSTAGGNFPWVLWNLNVYSGIAIYDVTN